MPNSRTPKEIRNPKPERVTDKLPPSASRFGFLSDFGFQISGFET
jgi:hypothetical protein